MKSYFRNKILKPLSRWVYKNLADLTLKILSSVDYLFRSILHLNTSKDSIRLLLILLSIFIHIFPLPFALFLSILSENDNLFIVILLIYGAIVALERLYISYFKKEDEEKEILTEQNTDNLETYDNLRTHYVLHNIKNSAKNMDWVLDGLSAENVKNEDLDNLRQYLKKVYETLDEFSSFNQIKEKNSFMVKELFEHFDKLVRPSLKAKGIKFFIKKDAETDSIRINQSFYDIFQVFNNLIINAEKALETTQKKEIYLSAERFESVAMIFRISDTGIGILDENKEKIFKIGYSTTNGTGLGLPYIQEVLNQIKGKIRLLESNNDFSTIFEVNIPAIKE